MANWKDIQKEWETSKITLKDLAAKHDVKLGTLKSRKSREGWSRGSPKKDETKQLKKDATKNKVATKKEPAIKSDNLNDKQRLFCIYYIKYFNATKAYQKAYECDYTTANVNGSRLLVNASVREEITRMKEEKSSGLLLSVDAILQKYIDIAFADITDFTSFGRKEIEVINDHGEKEQHEINYVDFKNHYEVDGTIITEVKQGKDGISVKLADKMKALEMLSKYFDLLSDNDKKRLQEEKLKTDIAKSKAETEKISTNKDTGPIEIMIKRKGDNCD